MISTAEVSRLAHRLGVGDRVAVQVTNLPHLNDVWRVVRRRLRGQGLI